MTEIMTLAGMRDIAKPVAPSLMSLLYPSTFSEGSQLQPVLNHTHTHLVVQTFQLISFRS